MTGKQIIIDGVDGLSCTNCSEAKRCQEQQVKKEYAINQVLQDIPSEYANVIARLKQIIPSVTRCDYVLEKQLKAKEQECEKLRFPMKDNNYAILTKEEFENFNQLKKENEQLKQTLAEIKEIAENNKHSFLCFTAFESDTIEVNNEPMATILQKIKECEVDNDL